MSILRVRSLVNLPPFSDAIGNSQTLTLGYNGQRLSNDVTTSPEALFDRNSVDDVESFSRSADQCDAG